MGRGLLGSIWQCNQVSVLEGMPVKKSYSTVFSNIASLQDSVGQPVRILFIVRVRVYVFIYWPAIHRRTSPR